MIPELETITVSYLRAHAPKVLNRVEAGKSIYITRYGKRIAVLIPFTEWEKLKDGTRKKRRKT